MLTESYYQECSNCGEELDTKDSVCSKCGSDELELIDERKTCALCGEKAEESDTCECGRCGRTFCDDCSGLDDIPYQTMEDYCGHCGSDFQSLWDSFQAGAEIRMDKVSIKKS